MNIFGGCNNNNDNGWIWILVIALIVLCISGDNSGNGCCRVSDRYDDDCCDHC